NAPTTGTPSHAQVPRGASPLPLQLFQSLELMKVPGIKWRKDQISHRCKMPPGTCKDVTDRSLLCWYITSHTKIKSLVHLSICLLYHTSVLMPRGQKSKLRAREKRRQAQEEPEDLVGVQPCTGVGANSPTAGLFCNPQGPQGDPPMGATAAAVSDEASDAGVGFEEGDSRSAQNPTVTEPFRRGPIDEKVVMMVHYMLYKYEMKEPISKGDMLRNVIQMYKNHFHEILRRASEYLELIFGLDLKEVDPNRHIYVLVNKLEPTYDGKPSGEGNVPKTGLLMTVLGVIFTKGNCATEGEVWEVLNMMGIYDGRKHFIYGEPRKLITEDLVQENYLEYRQVADSDPPRYEFLWGPRAHTETSKMKVLEFLAKIHATTPSAFPAWYEEALKDEEERAQARAAARARNAARADARSKAKGSNSSQVTMPRGQKSKRRAREKRREAQEEELEDLVVGEFCSCSRSKSSPTAGLFCNPQDPQGDLPMGATAAAVSDETYDVDANFQEGGSRSSWNPPVTQPSYRDPIDEKVVMMVYYMLYKYEMKEPISKGDMMRNVIQMYKTHFREILRRASEHMELIFGLDLKEVDPNRHIYVLVNKLEPTYDASQGDETGVPKTGLLMTILGVIFARGNCATEEEIWQILNVIGLYDGREHFIYGEPRKLITEDLVQENYLEYRQVADSDPPRYEFLWGPRAHTETSKMKVLEFLAKIHATTPSAFPAWYEEALKDEEERAQARAAARARNAARADARSKAKGNNSSRSFRKV
ncbi:Melanoma-associated antigen B10, partial [Galemys pyrenaicus]